MLVKVGISNRHVHLTKEDYNYLFGEDEFYSIKDLSQEGEFMSNKTLSIIGEKGRIDNVRVVGPFRNRTQVEISITDSYKLGVIAPIRLSGDLNESADIMLSNKYKTLVVKEGCIVAQRHLHIKDVDLKKYNLKDGQVIKAEIIDVRKGIIDNIIVRSKNTFNLELHLDTDEANAFNLKQGDEVKILEDYNG